MRWFAGRFSILGVALALICAGCGGGGAGISNGAPGIPSTGAGRAAKKGSAHFVIRVPKEKRRGRHPAYISPATQSMTIAIVQGSKPILNETVALTPGSKGCSASLTSTVCALTIGLAAGSYSISISTFDGANGTGNALSVAQAVAFTVALGKATPVDLTLSGVPASLLVVSDGVNAVDVLAKDADGNYIIGNGAPSFAAALTAGSAVTAIVQPTASMPNKIAFTAATPTETGTETIGVTASYPAGITNACAQAGAVCALPNAITATYGETLFVTNEDANQVLGFTLPFSSATQAAGYTMPAAGAYAIAIDPAGNIFVPTSGAGNLLQYQPPYSGLPAVNNDTGGIVNPYAVALDSNDDAFVANYANNTVTEYEPPYTAGPQTISSHVSQPYALALDSSNNLYVVNEGNDTVTVYPPPYTTTTPVTLSTPSFPLSVSISGGNLFVGEENGIEIFTLPVTNASTATTITSGVSDVEAMAFDSGGNLFASNNSGYSGYGSIEKFTTPFSNGQSPAVTIAENDAGSQLYYPGGLVFDSAGNLYVVNGSGGVTGGGVNEYQPPFTSASVPATALTTGFIDPQFAVLGKAALIVSP